MEVRNYQIYIHQNKINGKLYCGQTCQKLQDRFANGRGYKECPRFYNAIKKYGWNNFNHFSLIENLTHEEANIIETEIIKKYNLTNEQFGYNIDEGGAHSAPPIIDLTGNIFGRLKVIGRDNTKPGIYWLCECSCSEHNIVSVINTSLYNGATKSCGCLRKENNRNNKRIIHGMCGSDLYNQWKNMIKRNDAKNNIFQPWHKFSNFLSWANDSNYKEGYVVDRINRNKQYSPENCIWCTLDEYKQNLIKNNTVFYNYHDEQLTINELSDLSGLPKNVIRQRLINNPDVDIDEVLNIKYQHREKIKNTYDIFDSYVVVNIPNGYFIVDDYIFEKIKNIIWICDNERIIERKRKNVKTLHIESFLFNILDRHLKKVKFNFKNGNCFDFRKSNIEIVSYCLPTDYFYYLSNVNVSGLYNENNIWRVGKKGDYRKTFHDLSNALKNYDERYGTELFVQYKKYLKEGC